MKRSENKKFSLNENQSDGKGSEKGLFSLSDSEICSPEFSEGCILSEE